MAFVDFGRAAVIAGLGFAVMVSDVPIWVLYVVALGLGIGEVLFDSASGALIPMIVADESLEKANSRLHLSVTVANELSGPAIGAWLFAAAAAAPFLIDAGSFVFAASMVLTIRDVSGSERESDNPPVEDSLQEPKRDSMRNQIREGLQFVRTHPLLRTLAIVGAGYNFLATGLEAIAVLYIRTELGATNLQYGLVLTLAAIGGIGGALAAPAIYARHRAGPVIIIDILICAAFAFAAAASGTLTSWAIFDTVLFFGSAIASIGAQTLRQRAMPTHLAGRVTSVFLLALFGAGPLGAAFFGVLTTATSLTTALVGFGLGAVVLVGASARNLVVNTQSA